MSGAGAGAGGESGKDLKGFKNPLVQSLAEKVYTDDEFLSKNEKVITEKTNPTTDGLGELAQKSEGLKIALEKILQVEKEALNLFIAGRQFRTFVHNVIACVAKAKTNDKKVYLVGAGASGRLALSICRAIQIMAPKSVEASSVVPVLIGGDIAAIKAVEGAEDNFDAAEALLTAKGFLAGDSVIGISAAGKALSVRACLHKAMQSGGQGVMLCCNKVDKENQEAGAEYLEIDTCAPAVAGSTRMHPTTLMMIVLSGIVIQAKGQPNPFIEIRKQVDELIGVLSMIDINMLCTFIKDQEKLVGEFGVLKYAFQGKNPLNFLSMFADLAERGPTFGASALCAVSEMDEKLGDDDDFESLPKVWPVYMGTETEEEVLNHMFASSAGDISDLTPFDFSEEQSEKLGIVSSFLFSECDGNIIWLGLDLADSESEEREGILLPTVNLDSLFQSICLKTVLTAYSTALYAYQGCLTSNRMTSLTISNEKLFIRMCQLVKWFLKSQPLEKYGLKNDIKDRPTLESNIIAGAVLLEMDMSLEGVFERAVKRCTELIGVDHPDFKCATDGGAYAVKTVLVSGPEGGGPDFKVEIRLPGNWS